MEEEAAAEGPCSFSFHTPKVWSTSETSRPHDHQACQAPIRLKRLNLTTADPILSLRLIDQESRHSRVACPLFGVFLIPKLSRHLPRCDMSTCRQQYCSMLAHYAASRVGLGWLRTISPRQETAKRCRDQRASWTRGY